MRSLAATATADPSRASPSSPTPQKPKPELTRVTTPTEAAACFKDASRRPATPGLSFTGMPRRRASRARRELEAAPTLDERAPTLPELRPSWPSSHREALCCPSAAIDRVHLPWRFQLCGTSVESTFRMLGGGRPLLVMRSGNPLVCAQRPRLRATDRCINRRQHDLLPPSLSDKQMARIPRLMAPRRMAYL